MEMPQVFISTNHAKLLLLLCLFWISLFEFQTKFSSEIALNNVNRYVPIKCTYAINRSLGHCYCPKIDGKLKSFSCHCHTNEKNKTYGNYFCSCVHDTAQTNHINCTCQSSVQSLKVKCNLILNTNTIKVGVLIPFTDIFSTYQLGYYYHSAAFFALDYINHNRFLLANHSLGLVWGDTKCNKKTTVRLTMKMIEEEQVDALIAVGCESCLATAAIAGSYNIPMLSTVREINFVIVLCLFCVCFYLV